MKKIFLIILSLCLLGYITIKILGSFNSSGASGPIIKVYIDNERKTVSMKLEDYLVGVLAAEMPAKFEKEALKAQAIAARTYGLRKLKFSERLINQGHLEAEVCTNPAHCQGWLSDEEMREKWGWLKYWEYSRKLKAAVRETSGKVITYENELIEPVYHSTCGKYTENAEEVWKYPVPYLKSVPCRWDEKSPKYHSESIISYGDIEKRLGENLGTQSVSQEELKKEFTITERTSTGRIKSIKVGHKVLPATEFRRRLGLNSTNFSWEIQNEGIKFVTIGYGHGVGMCQYGANGQAKEGRSAEEILKYYYSGVKLDKLY